MVGIISFKRSQKLLKFFDRSTLFRMGLSEAAHGWGQKTAPPALHRICHTYPAMMKLGTAITYVKKTQKIYKSRDNTRLILLTSSFFHRKSANLAISENTDIN